jgi:hypothetical protein
LAAAAAQEFVDFFMVVVVVVVVVEAAPAMTGKGWRNYFELFRLISKELFIMTHRAAEPTRQTAAEKSAGAEKNKNWIVVVLSNDRGFEITGIRSKMHGNKTPTTPVHRCSCSFLSLPGRALCVVSRLSFFFYIIYQVQASYFLNTSEGV